MAGRLAPGTCEALEDRNLLPPPRSDRPTGCSLSRTMPPFFCVMGHDASTIRASGAHCAPLQAVCVALGSRAGEESATCGQASKAGRTLTPRKDGAGRWRHAARVYGPMARGKARVKKHVKPRFESWSAHQPLRAPFQTSGSRKDGPGVIAARPVIWKRSTVGSAACKAM